MKNKIQHLSDLLNLGGKLLLCLAKEKKNGNLLFLLHLLSKPLKCLNNLIKQVERKFFFCEWLNEKNGSFTFNLLMLPKLTSFWQVFAKKKQAEFLFFFFFLLYDGKKKKRKFSFFLVLRWLIKHFSGVK